MNCRWIECSEYDVAGLRKASRGVAVLPLGSIESHGPHLPLGNDWGTAHPEMAVGHPQKATKAKGERIFALWTGEVVGILRQIKRDRTAPAAMRAYARKAHAPRSRARRG